MTNARNSHFLELLANERGFHLLFCDLLESDSFSFYHNRAFAEDPIFNHFVISDNVLQSSTQLDQSQVNSIIHKIRSKAEELKLSSSIFLENFWERRGQFEKAAAEAGYRITDKMEILTKSLTGSTFEPDSRPMPSSPDYSPKFEVYQTEDIETWNNIFMRSYSIPPHWKEELIRREEQIISLNKAKFILTRNPHNNSTPCGCLLTFSATTKCVGIYCVGTVPELRGKGVAREMLNFAEKNALKDGAQLMTLQTLTSDHVAPMYNKFGYRTEFERNIYWSPIVS